MNYLYNYNIFIEARLSDVASIYGTGLTFDSNDDIDNKFLKFKTISNRIDNKKIRLTIDWNHNLKHDLVKRIKERTNFKNISELNNLVSNGLDELYIYNYNYIKTNGKYSLWFSEYDISIIIDINNIIINIITIIKGKITINVKNIIELKSTIL